jgi:hypothetical protein
MSNDLLRQADSIWPLLQKKVAAMIAASTQGTGSAGGVGEHEIGGSLHKGVLRDDQGPQFLLTSGLRSLAGNLPVDTGVTIDGVDLDVHAGNADAHHGRYHAFDSADHLGTLSWVKVNKTGASLADLPTRLYADLQTRTHSIIGGDHSVTGSAWQIVGVLSANTLGLMTPNANPGATEAILKTDAAGMLALAKLRTGLIDTASGDLVLNPASGAVKLAAGDLIQSNSFASGFAGSGFRLDDGVSVAGKTSGEMDNLTVRGLLRVYELLISKIRTGNGSYLFSDGGKVASVTGTGPYTLNFDEDHGLAANDLIRAQKFLGGAYTSSCTVTSVPTTKQAVVTLNSGNAPVAGYEYVRIGNTTDSSRRGSVYVTSNDSNAPYLDVIDGIAAHTDWGTAGKVRVRLGRLSGIAGGSGYGLFAGDNGAAWATVDAVSGFRAGYSGTTRFQVDTSGNLRLYNNLGATVIALDSNGNSAFEGVMTIGTSGEIRQGTGALGGNFTGLRIYRSGSVGMIAGYNNNVQQWYGNTDGKLYAGAGSVWLDSTGVNFSSAADGYADPAAGLRWDIGAYGSVKMFAHTNGTANSTGVVIQIPKAALNVHSALQIQEKDSPSSRLYRVWHDGNDGAGSALDAGLVAGMYPSSAGNRWGVIPYVETNGVMDIGKYIDFHDGDAETNDYAHRIAVSSGGLIYYPIGAYAGSISTPSNGSAYGYFEYIYNSTRSGYMIWNAQSINIYSDNNCHIIFAPNGTGKVGVNRVDPSYTLDVNGEFRATGAVRMDATLSLAAVSTPATSAVYSVVYVDSADGKLKYKTTGGVVRTISYT